MLHLLCVQFLVTTVSQPSSSLHTQTGKKKKIKKKTNSQITCINWKLESLFCVKGIVQYFVTVIMSELCTIYLNVEYKEDLQYYLVWEILKTKFQMGKVKCLFKQKGIEFHI